MSIFKSEKMQPSSVQNGLFYGKVEKGIRKSKRRKGNRYDMLIIGILRFRKTVTENMNIWKLVFLQLSILVFHMECLQIAPKMLNLGLNIIGALNTPT